jgi:predicted Holliday junction resolvase-like endonuclease
MTIIINRKLSFKVTVLRGEVEAKEYDLQKTKEERDIMMKEYDQRLRKKMDELNLERRELKKMREVMSRSTPSGSSKLSDEVQMLRDELSVSVTSSDQSVPR